jgi:hypothetical protein
VLPSLKGSGDFGTSSFYGQLSGEKLPVHGYMGRGTPSTMRGFEQFLLVRVKRLRESLRPCAAGADVDVEVVSETGSTVDAVDAPAPAEVQFIDHNSLRAGDSECDQTIITREPAGKLASRCTPDN